MEKLFGLGERRARQLMAGLPCLQVGNAAAVEREALIRRLESVARSPECERETVRRERIEKTLQEMRRQTMARRVELAVPGPTAGLPEGIQLIPGELTIRFSGSKDLAGKLFALSQTMINDWESFERWCGRNDH